MSNDTEGGWAAAQSAMFDETIANFRRLAKLPEAWEKGRAAVTTPARG